jgi:hypothetical protein
MNADDPALPIDRRTATLALETHRPIEYPGCEQTVR